MCTHLSDLIAIKLDMEQACDQMSWQFLRQMLLEFGFQDRWIDWIIYCVETLSFAILINGASTDFFHSAGGLCQDGPEGGAGALLASLWESATLASFFCR